MDKITAVLGLYECIDLTISFLDEFHSMFPDVMVAASVAGNSEEYQRRFAEKYSNQSWINFATGKTGQRISFSETWNYAINQITTERFVFLHNDMYVHKDFFKNLNKNMDQYGPNFFYLYTTVEPLENQGFVRPGKIVASFGHSREELDVDKFNEFADKYARKDIPVQMGYGFYLSGFTESLKDVGGFDSKHFFPVFCEDDDINVRIRLKGYKVAVTHQALVYHYGSKTLRLETPGSMSSMEIESNRCFARKWGFEARYLWNTGYERYPKISLGAEVVAFESPAHRGKGPALNPIDILNVEPIVDMLLLSPEELKATENYFKHLDRSKAFGDECPEYDILITIEGEYDFNEFAELVGGLRFFHEYLGVGKGRAGNYDIEVLRVGKDRVDTTNYLSESVTQ